MLKHCTQSREGIVVVCTCVHACVGWECVFVGARNVVALKNDNIMTVLTASITPVELKSPLENAVTKNENNSMRQRAAKES